MIRALWSTLVEDLRARASGRDIYADLWATYYTMKPEPKGQR